MLQHNQQYLTITPTNDLCVSRERERVQQAEGVQPQEEIRGHLTERKVRFIYTVSAKQRDTKDFFMCTDPQDYLC